MFLQARPLVSHPHRVNSSWNAGLLPPPRQFEPDRSSATPSHQFERHRLCHTSTMSSRARSLISCLHQLLSTPIPRLHQALSSPAACLPINHVDLSTTAHVSPAPCLPEPDRSRLPPPPSPFELERKHSFPASIASNRARTLVSHLRRVHSSATARLLPPPGPFELGRLSPTQPCPLERNRSSCVHYIVSSC